MDPFDLVGDVLDGQFRVEEFVGEGALSVVYRAVAETLDAPVAIKCLNLPSTLDDAFHQSIVESFLEGCKLHYRLARGHLAIAQTFGSGTTVAPRTGVQIPYVVREWYEGESLARDLQRRRAEGEAGRDLAETLALFEPIAEALAFAHREDAPHLSLMPSNLFLAKQRDGSIAMKLLDFGVGRVVDDVASSRSGKAQPNTRIQVLLPTYAAPEQLLGTLGPTGPWTDVYALALVLLEVLTDRAVMGAKDASAIVARTLNAKSRPSPREHGLDLPPAIDAVFVRALSLEPELRHANVEEMWSELVMASKPPRTRRLATHLRRVRRSRRIDVRRGRSLPPPSFREGFEDEEVTTAKARGVVSMLTARVRSSTRPPPPSIPSRRPPAGSRVPPPLKPKVASVAPVAPPPRPALPAAPPVPLPRPQTRPLTPQAPAAIEASVSAPQPRASPSVPPPPAYLTDLLAPFEASAAPIPPAPSAPSAPSATQPPAQPIARPPPLPTPSPAVILAAPPPPLQSELPSIIIDSSARVEPHEIPVLPGAFARPARPLDRRIVLGAIVGGVLFVALLIVIVAAVTRPHASAAAAASSVVAPPATSAPQIPAPPVASSAPVATTEPAATASAIASSALPSATTPPKPPGRFNRRAALASIASSTSDLSDCRRKGGVWGIGQAGVIFANDGSVRQVMMSPPFTGVDGKCVSNHIKRDAHIDPFLGIIGPVYAKFVIPYQP